MMPEEPLLASNHLSSILLHLGSQEIRHLMSQELTENRDGGGMVWVSQFSFQRLTANNPLFSFYLFIIDAIASSRESRITILTTRGDRKETKIIRWKQKMNVKEKEDKQISNIKQLICWVFTERIGTQIKERRKERDKQTDESCGPAFFIHYLHFLFLFILFSFFISSCLYCLLISCLFAFIIGLVLTLRYLPILSLPPNPLNCTKMNQE